MGGTLACLYAGLYPNFVRKMIVVEGVGHWWRFSERPPDQLDAFMGEAERFLAN